jgi:hypothetical protein|tara:strand:+ start:8433 stop:9962 length:1530 start_codon:yes stop_codon:yes gene_type:complete
MAELFGFQITRANQKAKDGGVPQSFTVPTADDGTTTVSAGGYFGSYLDMEGGAKNEEELIRRYREIAIYPEVDTAIDDIVNEAIVSNERDQSVSLSMDNLQLSSKIKGKIRDEFDEILKLLLFDEKGHDIFKRWYIDGRVYYHKVIDPENPRLGLTELRYIDPRKIRKVREIQKKKSEKGIEMTTAVEEWYVYNEKGMTSPNSNMGIKIAPDAISYCTSGVIDQNKNVVLSNLHKAIKPVNQLRMIEDAVVIYRIVRAPERRIFYIDVGNLPKVKAEQYLKDVMARYRNKLVYDASTGEMRDDRKHMSMLEDFWLPRREGGRGTEIATLPGGQNLGEINDVHYFQKRVYRSLHVPVSRMEQDQGFSIGKSAEITRDEVKFSKFVQRLRKRFTGLFQDLLKTQLVLKGIITIEDWDAIKSHMQYDFLQDGHFAELKTAEILRERLMLANEITPYVGKYFSVEYLRKNVLRQTDEEIEDINRQIATEVEDGIISDPMDGMQVNDIEGENDE